MKESLSGSIVNELEVQSRWTEMRIKAKEILTELKRLPEKKMVRVNSYTIKTELFDEVSRAVMESRLRERFKRTEDLLND